MQVKLPFSIYQYSSYQEFLQDSYDFLRSQDETISYEKIAEKCGLKSRTEARSLIKGTKKISEIQLSSMAKYLDLGFDETQYLICLMRFQEAGGSPNAYELFQKLITLQNSRQNTINPFQDIEVATSVLHLTLLSALEVPGLTHDPQVISCRLKNRFSAELIAQALKELELCGYIAKNVAGDGWVVRHKHVRKYDYNANFFLKKFHSQCLELAQNSLENETTSERYLVGASFCINGKVFSRIVQKMNNFAENLINLEGVAGIPDTVVQFNQQLIRMSCSEEFEQTGRGLGQLAERVPENEENPVIV